MANLRNRSGREGESLFLVLLLAGYYIYEKLITYPLVASLIIGTIVSLVIISILLIQRKYRIRKANLLAKESFYRDYTPIEFEHLTSEIFSLLGYKSRVTPPSGDKGIDVILISNQEKIGVQCKRYRDSIGPATIREFAGALEGAHLSKGFLVTTSTFTKAAREASRNSRSSIKLICGEELAELRNRAEKRVNTDLVPTRWWKVMPVWQKGLSILLFIICTTLLVGMGTYMLITMLET